MEIQAEGNVIYRCVPRENLEVNKYWLCDEGRFNYHYTQDPSRILEPKLKTPQGFENTSWEIAVLDLKEKMTGKKVLFLVGTDLTNEELSTIQEYVKLNHAGSEILSFGTRGLPTTAQDGPLDNILKMKSKTSNLNGAEKLGIKPVDPSTEKAFTSANMIVMFRGGRAQVPTKFDLPVYGVGVFLEKEAADFQGVLPSLAFSEKEGTITNHMGITQKIKRAILPRGRCKAVSEALMLLANTKAKAGVA